MSKTPSGVTHQRSRSPCVRNCCLDDNDICMGCYRSIQEIMQWTAMSDDERSVIILRTQTRKGLAEKKLADVMNSRRS
ncbi:DUF1289 domain-containing protein [Neptuniibacter pectenicola]|uniref:DUF1289 domain-containing protein n=1 Tax=Neptuniibacter pectenicola TaxID=1806669 RepID=UPI000946A825|nr:DUF1289 domain-containing protein [Neptuniibacter pectenicola]